MTLAATPVMHGRGLQKALAAGIKGILERLFSGWNGQICLFRKEAFLFLRFGGAEEADKKEKTDGIGIKEHKKKLDNYKKAKKIKKIGLKIFGIRQKCRIF